MEFLFKRHSGDFIKTQNILRKLGINKTEIKKGEVVLRLDRFNTSNREKIRKLSKILNPEKIFSANGFEWKFEKNSKSLEEQLKWEINLPETYTSVYNEGDKSLLNLFYEDLNLTNWQKIILHCKSHYLDPLKFLDKKRELAYLSLLEGLYLDEEYEDLGISKSSS